MCSGGICSRLVPLLFALISFVPKVAFAQHSASTTSTNGTVIYALNCIKCHGPNGGGVAGVVSIAGPSLKAEHNRPFVREMVTNGKAPMPSFRPLLSHVQIDAVADYVTTQIATIPLAIGEGGELLLLPYQQPFNTALGCAVFVMLLLVFFAGSGDVIAIATGTFVGEIRMLLRILFFVAPAVSFLLAYSASALVRQRHERSLRCRQSSQSAITAAKD